MWSGHREDRVALFAMLLAGKTTTRPLYGADRRWPAAHSTLARLPPARYRAGAAERGLATEKTQSRAAAQRGGEHRPSTHSLTGPVAFRISAVVTTSNNGSRRAAAPPDREGLPRPSALYRHADSLSLARPLLHLDMSVLKAKPAGRGAIRSAVRTAGQRDRVLDFVRTQCLGGRQAYVVLPVIEETEKADLRAASTMAESLTARWPELSVGLVHGKLKPDVRDRVMQTSAPAPRCRCRRR